MTELIFDMNPTEHGDSGIICVLEVVAVALVCPAIFDLGAEDSQIAPPVILRIAAAVVKSISDVVL